MMQLLKKIALSTIALSLSGCSMSSAPLKSVESLATSSDCRMPIGWADVAALNRQFVIFGETHGSAEAPAFVSDVICGLAMDGKRLLLAIEFSPYHNADLRSSWAGPTDQFADRLRDTGWVGRDDGVASKSMFAMVSGAHTLRQAGHPIDIVAFNGSGSDEQTARFADLPAQGPHEAAQAENILNASKEGEYDYVIVLVGNLHAKKSATSLGGVSFEPMAKRLSESVPTVSLNMRHAGGETWSCQLRPDFDLTSGAPITNDAIQCARHPASGRKDLEREPFIAIGTFPGEEPNDVYDGYYWLGPISASSPWAPKPE